MQAAIRFFMESMVRRRYPSGCSDVAQRSCQNVTSLGGEEVPSRNFQFESGLAEARLSLPMMTNCVLGSRVEWSRWKIQNVLSICDR
ncbi:hypothetical protein Y032_0108g83 [Ancylostoma ceylanicum]|nr:hypothetical protein Y032_0108g83 [Ancylostoma ceylanicum]